LASDDPEKQSYTGRVDITGMFLVPGYSVDPDGLEAVLLEAVLEEALRPLGLAALVHRYAPDLEPLDYVERGVLDGRHSQALTSALSNVVAQPAKLLYGELVNLLILVDLLERGDWVEVVFKSIAENYPAAAERWRYTQMAAGWLAGDGAFHRNRLKVDPETSLALLRRSAELGDTGLPSRKV
jgi:hypothetical protein